MNDSDIIKYLDKFKIIKWKLLDDSYQNYLINRYNNFYSTEKTNILRESYYRILNKWKEKDTKFYDNAITTWVIRDVNKRNIAKQNKLNYIEFWNIEELKIWINNGNGK